MSLPPKLFKYQSFNTISLSNLSNRQVYFCNPLEFNDPYDCALDITFKDLSEEDYKKFLQDYFSKKAGTEITPEIIKIIFESESNIEAYKTNVDEGLNRALKELKENYLSSRGIVSLSANKNDIIMWGHYSDGHKGFCLEFDTSFKPFESAKKVTYSDNIPELDASKILILDEANPNHIVKPLTTKFIHWIYENEYRLIHLDHSLEYNYKPEALTAVYFGIKMDKVTEDIIAMILKERYPHVKMYRALKRDDSFKLDFEETMFKT